MQSFDVLYLGCNMGNCGYRFFSRYKQARDDYYMGFKWLLRALGEEKGITIGVKHHQGDYRPSKDKFEQSLIKESNIITIDNQLNSYALASRAKLVVAYFSTMILELRGYPHLSYFIRNSRKQKRYLFRKPCKGNEINYQTYNYKYPPAYFLDPGGRNRHFCAHTDEICVHDCEGCKPVDLEIYEPYRLKTYEQFKEVIHEVKGY